jgi:hypothetical protein
MNPAIYVAAIWAGLGLAAVLGFVVGHRFGVLHERRAARIARRLGLEHWS